MFLPGFYSRFQSTLPRRERPALFCVCVSVNFISIHAPAKGATRMMREILLNGSQFQSTLPRRERRKDRVQGLFTHSFQSTLPRRERRYIHVVGMRSLHFNPRSREGSDLSDMATSISISPFQSTLPRRERLKIRMTYRR